MKKPVLLAVICLLYISVTAQEYIVSGIVSDSLSGESLAYSTCVDTISKRAAIADENGYFRLKLKQNRVCFSVSYVGYTQTMCCAEITNDTTINFKLSPKVLPEIKVFGAEEPIHKQTLMGKTNIPIMKMKNIPSFLGETDIIKAITFIPGFNSGKDGFSQLYVRGGDKGQNLILFDGVPIYNIGHVFNFLSIFNSDIVKNVDVYKESFPARYGGRTASVIDIQVKDGNKYRHTGKFNLGLLTSSFMLEGPIIKEKLSYIVSLRCSYTELFTLKKTIEYNKNPELYRSQHDNYANFVDFNFFDANAKLSYKLNRKTNIYAGFFTSNDYLNAVDDYNNIQSIEQRFFNYKLNNSTVSAGLTHYFTNSLSYKFSVAGTKYFTQIKDEIYNSDFSFEERNILKSNSEIATISVNSNIDWFINDYNNYKIGISLNKYKLAPGLINTIINKYAIEEFTDTLRGLENSSEPNEFVSYIENEIKLNSKTNLNIGVRFTAFNNQNKTYYEPEPRISFRNLISDDLSVKLSYSLVNQFLVMIHNNSAEIGRDIWMAASDKITPQKAHQISGGIFGSKENKGIEYSAEVFYKQMSGFVDYKYIDIDEVFTQDWESLLIKNGTGNAYGLELFFKKKTKKFEGLVSYVLSWNYRQFEQLNNGKPFPFDFDKRHDLNILIQYMSSEKWNFGANFALNSGFPVTLPESYVKTNDLFIGYYVYDKINNNRMPLYHRLDVFAKRSWIGKKNNKNRFVSFNIYNVYARQNASNIYYSKGKVYSQCLFIIIPTLNFGMDF